MNVCEHFSVNKLNSSMIGLFSNGHVVSMWMARRACQWRRLAQPPPRTRPQSRGRLTEAFINCYYKSHKPAHAKYWPAPTSHWPLFYSGVLGNVFIKMLPWAAERPPQMRQENAALRDANSRMATRGPATRLNTCCDDCRGQGGYHCSLLNNFIAFYEVKYFYRNRYLLIYPIILIHQMSYAIVK